MKIYVDISEYRFAHGTVPKGFGYWAFKIGSEVFWFSANYGRAKEMAFEKARELKKFVVKVCS